MKILVFSDSHYQNENMLVAISHFKNEIDAILHLGDCIEDALHIEENFKNKQVYYVNGNNDLGCEIKEKLITLNGHNIYMTHGHLFNVYSSLNALYYRAKEQNASICLYGHTHKMFAKWVDNMLILNPGSISLPRGIRKYTFAIIDINEDIKYKFFNVDGENIEKI